MQDLFAMLRGGLGVALVAFLAIAAAIVAMQIAGEAATRIAEWERRIYWPLAGSVLAIIGVQIGSTLWLAYHADAAVKAQTAVMENLALRIECQEIEVEQTLVQSNDTHRFDYRPMVKGTTCDQLLYGQ